MPLGEDARAHSQAAAQQPSWQTAVVQLKLGQTTLADLTKALSSQAGITVEPADYLRGHRLVVQIGTCGASNVLDLICDLNGWRWEEDKAGHVTIFRKRPDAPHRPFDVARSLQSALPLDWQRFLGYRPKEDGLTDDRRFSYKQAGSYEQAIVYPLRRRKIRELTTKFAAQLVAFLKDRQEADTHFLFTSLPKEQAEKVITCLVLALFEMLQSAPAAEVALGITPPYLIDAGSATISVRNGGISVDVIEERDGIRLESGFAASIRL